MRATRNTFSGEILFKSERMTLRDHLFRANGLETDQAGLTVIKTSKLRVAGSEIRDNGDIGIYGEDNAGSEIVENEIAGNPEAEILIDGAPDPVRPQPCDGQRRGDRRLGHAQHDQAQLRPSGNRWRRGRRDRDLG